MAIWKPGDQFRDALSEASHGLRTAHFSLETTAGRAFKVVVEWIHWTMLLDEQMWKVGGDRYEHARHGFPAGKALLGVRHANNVVKHHGAHLDALVDLVDGLAFPAVFAAVFREISWVPIERLPTMPERYRNARQEAAYATWLSGRPVRDLASGMTEFLLNVAVPTESGGAV